MDKNPSAVPTAADGKASPRPPMAPQIVLLDETSDLGPLQEFAAESPSPVTKLVPRKPLEPTRVSVVASARAPAKPVQIPAPLVAAIKRDWRSISIGLLAVVVVLQAGFMASGLLLRGGVGVPPTTGSVTVTSSPGGSPIRIDGTTIGQTPLTISLADGSHRIEVGSGPQLRGQDLSVTGGGSASIHIELASAAPPAAAGGTTATLPKAAVAVAARPASDSEPQGAAPATVTGWLAITSGIPMQVLENGKLVGTSEMARIPLPAGQHELELVNAALGYRVLRVVQVTAGQTASFGLRAPMGSIAINALPWAEVWIDGQRVGDTPIGNFSIAIGNHEVLFRHPEFGEQRRTVTVGAQGPARIGVDMKKP